jgi:hypothetical protein
MMVVQLQKPANMTLAVWFAALRLWLDENQCEPALFTRSGRIMDNILFDFTFENDTHARLFAANFRKYAPSIRRTFVTERLDFLRRGSRERPNTDKPAGPLIEERDYGPASSFEPNPSCIAR